MVCSLLLTAVYVLIGFARVSRGRGKCLTSLAFSLFFHDMQDKIETNTVSK